LRKPASVHIDIAEFAMTVMELKESKRAEWLLSLVKSLSYADPTLNEYGANLLNEVEAYRKAERERKEQYKPKGDTRKDTERHGKTTIPESDTTVSKTDRTEQTEQKVLKKKEDGELFESIWKLYGKKGNRKTSITKWSKLPKETQDLIFKKVPAYVESTPDKQYRKNFETYLNQESWNDEIIKKQSGLFGNNESEDYQKELDDACNRKLGGK